MLGRYICQRSLHSGAAEDQKIINEANLGPWGKEEFHETGSRNHWYIARDREKVTLISGWLKWQDSCSWKI